MFPSFFFPEKHWYTEMSRGEVFSSSKVVSDSYYRIESSVNISIKQPNQRDTSQQLHSPQKYKFQI